MGSFGVKFGVLVRQKRGVEGLTQEALAFKAFGPKGRKAQISELENGRIDNPQAATVDALVVALGITPEELAACRTPIAAPIPPGVERPELPPLLLENLAMRFGIESPDAPPAELEAFLKDAAVKHREMAQRLAAMTAEDPRLENLLGAAQAAIDAGEFAEADDRLADAEEIQQTEHTLKQVRKQAQMRKERGRAALLNFDVDKAYGHFAEAAAYFEPFDKVETAKELLSCAVDMREHGLRHPGQAPANVVRLCRKRLTILDPQQDLEEWCSANRQLGLALQEEGIRQGGDAGHEFLAEAVAAYRAVLEVCSPDFLPTEWASTQNNLAIALQEQGIRAEGDASQTLLGEAFTAYRAALQVRTHDAMPVDWAATQNNLGIALSQQGSRAEGEAGQTLLGEAVTAHRAALQVRTRDVMPVNWAITQNNLGIALRNQGSRAEGEAGQILLGEAVTAYRAALEVRTPDAMPVDWAGTHHNMAIVFEALADAQPVQAKAHLREALRNVDLALEIYDPEHTAYRFGIVTRVRERIVGKLAALKDGAG